MRGPGAEPQILKEPPLTIAAASAAVAVAVAAARRVASRVRID